MLDTCRFDRMELSGALGDLGALLPIAMILVNGLNPVEIFFSIAVFFMLSGMFYGVTVPVQPMKVIGAYAIATAMEPSQILASSLLMSIFLLLAGLTGAIERIRKHIPVSVIRGVQLSTGALLISGGVRFILRTSNYLALQHAAEPHLAIQSIGPFPVGIVLGVIGAVATFLLLDNKKFPVGLVIVSGGLGLGLVPGIDTGLGWSSVGFHLPEFFPLPFPGKYELCFPKCPPSVGLLPLIRSVTNSRRCRLVHYTRIDEWQPIFFRKYLKVIHFGIIQSIVL